MKKAAIFFCTLLLPALVSAQSSVGLIAHWPMNVGGNDTSGNGHNGILHNVTESPGFDSVGGSYYFNGVNSMITVPYSLAFNVTNFTICATVKAEGFYSGLCQGNTILNRGKTGGGTGNYYLYFGDWPYDNDCDAFDSTKDAFAICVEGRSTYSSGTTDYTPHMVRDTWYKVVGVFNDTSYKLYVNGSLMSTAILTSAGVPMGSSTDSICIGYNIFEAASGYPYPFKGYIDDIMLYNRVLNDSEIVHYTDTCGRITLQPVNDTAIAGGTVHYSIASSVLGALYQWQENTGSGFTNLSNTAPYSGVYTPTLTITGAASGMSSNHYRCLVSNTWGCADTSASSLLSVSTTGVAPVAAADNIEVYPNPTTGKCFINLPAGSNATIELIGITDQLLLKQTTDRQTETIDMTGLASGVYILRIECNGNITYRKLAKH